MERTVPRGRNAFGDPANGAIYLWRQNHKEEQSGTRLRQIDSAQPLGSRWRVIRSIRTQGASDDAVFKLGGLCPTMAQHEAFLHYMALSQQHSIYFYHFAGELYECLLTDYAPQRKYLQRGPKGEHYVFNYTIQIDVLSVALIA